MGLSTGSMLVGGWAKRDLIALDPSIPINRVMAKARKNRPPGMFVGKDDGFQ